MKHYLISFVTVVLLAASCAGWQGKIESGLDYAHEAGVAIREAGAPLLNQKCKEAAYSCVERGITDPADCTTYVDCVRVRSVIAKSLIALQQAIMDGKTALAIDDAGSAEAATARALELVYLIRKQLMEHGVL